MKPLTVCFIVTATYCVGYWLGRSNAHPKPLTELFRAEPVEGIDRVARAEAEELRLQADRIITRAEKIVNDAFETGLMLGWCVRDSGGTREDIALFVDSKRRNNPEPAQQWFDARKR